MHNVVLYLQKKLVSSVFIMTKTTRSNKSKHQQTEHNFVSMGSDLKTRLTIFASHINTECVYMFKMLWTSISWVFYVFGEVCLLIHRFCVCFLPLPLLLIFFVLFVLFVFSLRTVVHIFRHEHLLNEQMALSTVACVKNFKCELPLHFWYA